MKQDRTNRIVICNLHYSIPIDEIKEELQKRGHPVRNIFNIRHRVTKHPLSMFYVDLEPKENNKEIYNLQYLNNMKINVEPPNKKKKHHIAMHSMPTLRLLKSLLHEALQMCEMRRKPYDNRMPKTERNSS